MLPVSSQALHLEEECQSMDQMGEYLVRRLVGEGGMGKVYEAEERLSKRRVALKVLHPELSKSDHARKLFVNEMQILARLEHPNIVRSLASIEVGGEFVMVLEFLEGRTLRSVLHERGRLPWLEAAQIVSSVASALATAHGQDPPVIHRDLKPENIMVVEGGSIKVMDFGIAKVIEAMNQTNTQSVGTLQYMSPEQIDAHTIDHRSDLYCLGLVFYELLAGKPPFSSSSPRQLLNLQCTAEPPPLGEEVRSGLPKGVEDLLFSLLEKAPEDRPYLAEDVVEALAPFLPAAARPGAVTRVPASPRAARSSQARPDDAPSDERASGPRLSASLREPDRRSTPSGSAGRPSDESLARPADSAPIVDRSRSPRAPSAPATEEAGARREPAPRADTIALLDRPTPAREVPQRVAVAIIVACSLLAGIVAYVLRASSAPSSPEASPSAAPSSSVGGATTRPKRR